MLPPKFASARQADRSGSSLGIPHFRDDTGIVGFRYEKTKRAELPTLLPPPRHPLRSASHLGMSRSTTTSPNVSRPASPTSFVSLPATPVVVAPPASLYMPVVRPPPEQHPALRSPLPPSAKTVESWKRDSGHAGTTNSGSSIIHEEDCEEDCDRDCAKQQYYPMKLKHLDRDGDMFAAVEHAEHIADDDQCRALQGDKQGKAAARIVVAASRRPSSSSESTTSPTRSTSKFYSLIKSTSARSPKKLLKRSPSSSGFSFRKSTEMSDRIGEVPLMEPRPKLPLPRPRGTPAFSTHPTAPDTSAQNNLPPSTTDSDSASRSTLDLDAEFSPLSISIPTDNLLDDAFMAGFSFSKRGSLMFGGKRATVASDGTSDSPSSMMTAPAANVSNGINSLTAAMPTGTRPAERTAKRPVSSLSATDAVHRTPMSQTLPDIRVLSPDIEKESRKVRSLYQTGDAINWENGARFSFCEHLEPTPEVPVPEEDSYDPVPTAHLGTSYAEPRSGSSFSLTPDSPRRLESELAGGLEDWEDVDGADVDRYGFIAPRPPVSRGGTPTELKSAQLSPRRRNVLHKRDAMGFSSHLNGGRTPSRKVSARSLNTVDSEVSVTSLRSARSAMRQASNLLPQNRNRRWMDEAGDMLTVSPNLQDTPEEAQIEKLTEVIKKKEWERSEKWRKMAKVVSQGDVGHGMEFEFDAKNPKLIKRTWKGIPDRWRAAAWWSFLNTAAKEHEAPTAEDIIASFHILQERSSPDDVQIDLDVPRTISQHIMFRRRYRGGQRLLFRALHALSIYFPDTGYVQGMASLAATLLCYFDEEKCFVMLVRMWHLRGLEKLYLPGFDGLMAALREYDSVWLNKEVSQKLVELGIDSTAYGTRWYLTLFNLSIPFAAQLRVWDVFILLGDGMTGVATTGAETDKPSLPKSSETQPVETGLDILHATSAALILAHKEMLLDSDFENAMKTLTSWMPIKDEDLLMKVAKAEWKAHLGKKKT